jgi:hypothetical protein
MVEVDPLLFVVVVVSSVVVVEVGDAVGSSSPPRLTTSPTSAPARATANATAAVLQGLDVIAARMLANTTSQRTTLARLSILGGRT